MASGKQMVLRPLDIPVALRLVESPGATYQELADDLGMSKSTAHDAVERLAIAHLLLPDERRVNHHALLEFLEHGVRYAFPARPMGIRGRGVPTAHSAPPLNEEIDASNAWVWPYHKGKVEGEVITPLYDHAVDLPERCASVYEMLALVDALRAGRARERKLAMNALRKRLGSARMGDHAA
jgi:hypothetical protein